MEIKQIGDDISQKSILTSELINDLKSGLSRWKKEDLGFGSIEEKYSLSFSEMKQIVEHPRLKGVRVKIPTLIIIDDLNEEAITFKSEDTVETLSDNLETIEDLSNLIEDSLEVLEEEVQVEIKEVMSKPVYKTFI